MTADTQIIPIAAERLSRLRQAVMLASEGAFGDAIALLESLPQDDFGELEEVVRALVAEYRMAVQHTELAIEEFQASKKELQKKVDTVEEQRAAILKLSAPIIDVWDDIITVPLTGVLDSVRVQEIGERLLARVHQARTAWVILDLTGVDVADAPVVSHLMRLASAVRLMGVGCLLTGMRAHVAQALVALGTSLEGLTPVASLKEGLKYCLARSLSPRGART
jgi:rsbT co-antagonist protein RsbR